MMMMKDTPARKAEKKEKDGLFHLNACARRKVLHRRRWVCSLVWRAKVYPQQQKKTPRHIILARPPSTVRSRVRARATITYTFLQKEKEKNVRGRSSRELN